MLANYERRYFDHGAKAWLGRYYDLKSMAHWHNEIELIYVQDGELKIGVNSEIYYATAGDLVVCNSGDIHYCESHKNGSVADILIFKEDLVRSVNLSLRLACPYVSAHTAAHCGLDAQALLCTITDELKGKNRFCNEVIGALLVAFFARCYRYFETNELLKNGKQNLLQAFQLLFEYIDTNYAFMEFDAAAALMHFTPSYFSRVFKSIAGTTFTEYLNFIKVEKALDLIKEGDLSITQISMKCGFDSTRNFNRVFKKLTGLTPTEIPGDFTLKQIPRPRKPTEHESFNPTIHVSKIIVQK